MARRRSPQTSLFAEDNIMSREELLRRTKKRGKPESKLMNAVALAARSQSLPCFHIEYYCGNRFKAMCPDCQRPLICPKCHRSPIAHCHKRINTELTGQPDLIGIAWGIETKHMTTKSITAPKGTPAQKLVGGMYQAFGIPYFICNEGNSDQVLPFLQGVRDQIYGNTPLYRGRMK